MTDNSSAPPAVTHAKSWSFSGKALLVLALLALPLGHYLHRDEPNYYDPSRTYLVEAGRQLEIYHHDVDLLVQESGSAAEALRTSIGWLRRAAATDPGDLSAIDAIAAELEHWEQLARDGTLSRGELHDRYAALAARVQQLIDRRASPRQRKPRAN